MSLSSFDKFIVNTLPKAIVVSLIVVSPLWLGLLGVGLIAHLAGSDRHGVGAAAYLAA
jgi:hypothetical protein